MGRRDGLPKVRVIKQPAWIRPSWWRRRALQRSPSRPVQWREIGRSTVEHVLGLWPLVAVLMLTAGLMWTMAMSHSP